MKKWTITTIITSLLLWMLSMVAGCAGNDAGNVDRRDNTSSTEVAAFGSDGELEAYLKNQYAQSVLPYSYGDGSDVAVPAAGPPESGSEPDTATGEHSETNIQETGVDESDKVKTDGNILYVAVDQGIRIVDISGEMALLTTEPVGGTIDSLYLYGDRLVVLYTPMDAGGQQWLGDMPMAPGSVGLPYWIPVKARQGVAIYDVSEPVRPVRLKAFEFDGYLVSSRLIAGRLHLVQQFLPVLPSLDLWYDGSPADLQNTVKANEQALAPLSLDQMIPYYTIASDASPSPLPTVASKDIYHPVSHDCGGTITTVVTIDLDDDALPFTSVGMVADAHIVYASARALYTATHKYASSTKSEQSTIYKFNLTGQAVRCVAGGRVPGWILNQFSLGEYQDVLRVATTTGHVSWGSFESRNHLFCLQVDEGELKVIGRIEDLAPGEQIYAARFMAERGYLVTYVKIDPLFTLDLSNPAEPRVVGELKVPGYSDYIHPWGDDYLITIGKNAEFVSEDNMAWYQGVQMSIFDVSDFTAPVLLHTAQIGDRGTGSEALYNHKAFTFWPERNLLAIPINLCEHLTPPPVQEPWTYGTPTFDGLYVYKVTTANGFEPLGRISVGQTSAGYSNWQWTRGIFRDDEVFAVTSDGLNAAEIDHIEGTIQSLLY